MARSYVLSIGDCRGAHGHYIQTEASGQLPSGNFVPAKMPMVLVHPRPDSETIDWARNRKAYPDGVAEYRIPIAIQGGAYPFYFDLVNGPSGMTIGETVGDDDYGVISWTPTVEGGPYDVEVTVTDQDLATLQVEWTVESVESGFIFIDPTVTLSGVGTKGDPLKTFADLHLGSTADDTFSGQIVYLREGTHDLEGPADKGGNLQLQDDWKPAVFLGYTNEDAVVDCVSAKFLVDHQDDVFIGGFRMTGARNDVANAHFWYFNQNHAQSRVTFFEIEFDDIARGTLGTDNPAAITFFNPTILRNYFTLWGSSLDNYSCPIVDLYSVKYAVLEKNVLGNGKLDLVNQGIYLKSDMQNFSVRRNTSLVQDFWYGAIEFGMGAQTFTNDMIEFSYNLILMPAAQEPNRAIVYN